MPRVSITSVLIGGLALFGGLFSAGGLDRAAAAGTTTQPCGLLVYCAPTTTTSGTDTTTTTTPAVVPGASFEGLTTDRRDWSSVTIDATGTRINRLMASVEHGYCSNGQHYGTGGSWKLPDPTIQSSGQAGGTIGPYRAYTLLNNGQTKVWGQEQTTVSVQFAGDQVQWTFADRFAAPHLSCSTGTLHFTGFRVGTPQAPTSDAVSETGHYLGAGTDLWLQVPVELITSLQFTAELGCGDGGGLVHREQLYSLPVSHGHFGIVGHVQVAGPGGRSGTGSYVIVGQLTHAGSAYQASWRFTEHQTLYDQHGHAITRCAVSGERFSATGPGALQQTTTGPATEASASGS